MSRKNYTNYSNVKSNSTPVEEKPIMNESVEEVVADVVETEVEETVETVEAPEVVVEESAEPVYGVVDKCEKLNIRKNPNKNSEPVCVVPAKTELMIDSDKSTSDWYSVRTAAGVEGFCMKNFITIK